MRMFFLVMALFLAIPAFLSLPKIVSHAQVILECREEWPKVSAQILEIKEIRYWGHRVGRGSVIDRICVVPYTISQTPDALQRFTDAGGILIQRVFLKYRYTVKGRVYESTKVGRFSSDLDRLEALRLALRSGEALLVHYNPRKPQEASIFAIDNTWANVADDFIYTGCLFLVSGIFVACAGYCQREELPKSEFDTFEGVGGVLKELR